MSEVRLIDANALWEFMRTYDDYQGAKEAHDLELIHRDSILFAIESAPTVDAVPVVRCEDCKHYIDTLWIRERCGLKDIPVDKNDYCADGERKDGERRSDEDQHIYD